jgi:hypothetical protein
MRMMCAAWLYERLTSRQQTCRRSKSPMGERDFDLSGSHGSKVYYCRLSPEKTLSNIDPFKLQLVRSGVSCMWHSLSSSQRIPTLGMERLSLFTKRLDLYTKIKIYFKF